MKKKQETCISFAHGLNFFKLFWIFYLGCLFGVIVETVWCIITNGYFEYRTALILEPLNPVYGLGAVLISVLFYKAKGWKNIFIFLLSTIVGGLFEAICSLFQEFIFGTVSWHYSRQNLGVLGNRTSIVYCIFWGILGILWVRFIFPLLEHAIEKIPNKVGKILSIILVIYVSFDCIFSAGALLRQKERRNNIPPTSFISVFYDNCFPDDVLKIFYHNMKTRGDINY